MKRTIAGSTVHVFRRLLPVFGMVGSMSVLFACHSNGDLPPLASDEEMVEARAAAADSKDVGPSSGESTNDSDQPVPHTVAEPAPSARFHVVRIDGRFDDWQDIPPVMSKTADESESASFSERMLRNANSIVEVAAAYDDEWVYLKIERSTVSNLQNFDGTLRLEFDLDGYPLTGVVRTSGDENRPGLAGVDAQIEFSPRHENGETFGVAAAILEQGAPPLTANPYAFEASFAPTYASDVVEMRFRRGVIPPGANVSTFVGNSARGRFVWFDANGRQAGFTDPFTISFDQPVLRSLQPDPSSIDWRHRPYQSVRIVSWNVERGQMFNSPDSYSRVLSALNPDVICFQELGEDATTNQLRAWMDEHLRAPDGWEVRVQSETGTGIASKLSAVRAGPRAMPRVANSDWPVRAAMMIIGHDGRRIVLSSLHLKCCGHMGDASDQRRVAETTAIRGLVADAVRADNAFGFVHVGDFNLVGSREPLDILMEGTDLDGSDLLDVAPYRVGDPTNTTWRDSDQPFLPGRLDFALVSDATIKVNQAFVFDTTLLDMDALSRFGLMHDDTSNASDHLPIVIDVRW